MKKRLFAIILSTMMLVCSMAPLASSAVYEIKNAKENGDIGGFDFHSITIHYDKPTVLQYNNVTANESKKDSLIPSYTAIGKMSYVAGYVFAEPEDTYVIRAGDSLGAKGTAYNTYKSAVRDGRGEKGNFLALTGNGHNTDVYYTTFPDDYGYLYNIHNNDLIQTIDPIGIRGVTEIVDDAGNPNPNIEFGEDGYARDVNGGRIDDNGYLIDEHDEWYSIDANGNKQKLQLFKVINGEAVPMPRYNKDGRIIKISQYDGAMVYVVDENGNVAKDSQGNELRGTPALGTPVMKSKITKITIEIDALGDKLYSDVTSDPQQKNTVTLSLGNTKENIEFIPESGTIIGTAKCVTTRTEAPFDKKAEPTTQSIEIEASDELLEKLTSASARLYVQFGVETLQDKGAYKKRYTMPNNAKNGIRTSDVKVFTDADKDAYASQNPDNAENSDNSLLYWIIGGAAILVVLIVVVIIIVMVTNKKKSNKKSKK